MSESRVLFLLKFRDEYGPCSYSHSHGLSSGLYNSASFINSMLQEAGVCSKLVQVTDNNDIDREVALFKPTLVIIEALWVVPEKFDVLIRFHPKVKWIVRCHSEIPFLANESIAIDWLVRYLEHEQINISGNSIEAINDLREIVSSVYTSWPEHRVINRVVYLPNFYPIDKIDHRHKRDIGNWLDVGCFGSVRPMKNQLIQAVAAMEAAQHLGKRLRFHINGTRCEQGGISTLKNLKALLNKTGNELVLHPWLSHEDFLSLLRTMDVGLQVSFSETFNIVAADMVAVGLPIVVSPEIKWASKFSFASPTSVQSIKNGILRVIGPLKSFFRELNIHDLRKYVHKSREIWLDEVKRKRF